MGAIYNSVCKLSLLTSVIIIYQCYTEHYTLNISRQAYCLCYLKKILPAAYSAGSFNLEFFFLSGKISCIVTLTISFYLYLELLV